MAPQYQEQMWQPLQALPFIYNPNLEQCAVWMLVIIKYRNEFAQILFSLKMEYLLHFFWSPIMVGERERESLVLKSCINNFGNYV